VDQVDTEKVPIRTLLPVISFPIKVILSHLVPILPRPAQQSTMASESSLSSLSEAAPKPYSAFTPLQKKYIVFTAAGAGLFSSLSAQIYFPALNTLAKDLNVSASAINLTVTSYMVSIFNVISNHSNKLVY